MAYNHHYRNTFLIGTAVAAGILGTLTTLMRPRQRGWTSQAKEMANHVAGGLKSLKTSGQEAVTRNFMIGGVAGSMIGAAAALLLTPKSGRDLIRDLSEPLYENFGYAKPRSRRATSPARSAARAAKSATKLAVKKATRTAKHVVSPSPKRAAQRKSTSSKHSQSHSRSYRSRY